MPDYRFEVALSFPGEYRRRIKKIAELLARRLGGEKVLYDRFYEAEFARPNLNVYLPKLYQQSRLLVFFRCADYASKEWTGVEWRVGLDLLKKREDDRLMFLRLDDAEIDRRMVKKFDVSENTRHYQVGFEGLMPTLRGDFFVM
jgi:hypothetical protein